MKCATPECQNKAFIEPCCEGPCVHEQDNQPPLCDDCMEKEWMEEMEQEQFLILLMAWVTGVTENESRNLFWENVYEAELEDQDDNVKGAK